MQRSDYFRWFFIIRFLLSAMMVSVSILIDNAVDLGPMFRAGTGSLYYFFMGSISLGGLFGVYFAPTLCVLPYFKVKSLHMSVGKLKRNAMATFMVPVVYGGCVLCFGYFLLFGVLKCCLPTLMPYEVENIIENSLTNTLLPYERFLVSGFGLGYFVSALWYGFLSGCLYGGVSFLTYVFTHSYNLALLSPYLGMLWMTYAAKFAGIPDSFRLDMWLKMRATIGSEEQTLYLATLLVLAMIISMCVIFSVRERMVRNVDS